MTCPYSEPKCASDIPPSAQRCQCRRFVRHCAQCQARNRAFANFCRACGAALAASTTNWTGYKGSSRRLGAVPLPLDSSFIAQPPSLQLKLGDTCRSLLGYDGHIVAISTQGVVEIADPKRAKSVCRFQTQGPITSEPCINDGVLYIGGRGHVSAYSLGPMAMDTPRVKQLWQIPITDRAVHALTAAGDRLFVTIAAWDRPQVHVIDHIDRPQVSASPLAGGNRVSWIAADPSSNRAVFFSETDGDGVQLHVAGQTLTTHAVPLDSLANEPIALLGGKIFGIFGSSRRLYRIDVTSGAIVEPLEEDVHFFALSCIGEDWDRDGVYIDSGGVVFLRSGIRDSFAAQERAVKGSPVIIPGTAAIVGMEDGRVRIYSFEHAPRHETWRVGGNSSAAITALASFESYVAAGNSEGIVEVRELRAREATP